jgi:hypothetical protein
MLYNIMDLDHTVICSKHRKCTLPDGNLDLDHWIANCTPEKIALDSLLPLAVTMRKAYYSGLHQVIVCTARVLGEADYSFFLENDLPYHAMLDRPEGCSMPDAELKDVQLRLYAHSLGISWAKFASQAVVYDDNQAVLKRLKSIGIVTMDAVEINRIMAV